MKTTEPRRQRYRIPWLVGISDLQRYLGRAVHQCARGRCIFFYAIVRAGRDLGQRPLSSSRLSEMGRKFWQRENWIFLKDDFTKLDCLRCRRFDGDDEKTIQGMLTRTRCDHGCDRGHKTRSSRTGRAH